MIEDAALEIHFFIPSTFMLNIHNKPTNMIDKLALVIACCFGYIGSVGTHSLHVLFYLKQNGSSRAWPEPIDGGCG